jgi:hypothetical protein
MRKNFKILFIISIITCSFAGEPGKDYFPTSAADWVYMSKYDKNFSDSQKTRAAYQAIAIKLDEICNCNTVYKVSLVSNNGGRFWEGCWKTWQNNYTENQKVLDIIISTIDSLKTPNIIKRENRSW